MIKIRLLLLLVLSVSLIACSTTQQAANQSSSLDKFPPISDTDKNETVVLLHGLNRTSRAMRPMSNALHAKGYSVCNIGYPSRYFSIDTLAHDFVLPRIEECLDESTQATHFVTHSMGGMLVRSLDAELNKFPQGRLVMLSPPNQGSVAVDKMSNTWGFGQMAGPAGGSLGTDPASVAKALPIPSMPFGVIGAKHSNSAMSWLIPGDDDGKVSLKNMQLKQMKDFIVISSTHSFMMRDSETISQVLNFLETGAFLEN